jgi:hypothetical protein
MLNTITKGMVVFLIAMSAFLTYTNWASGCGLAWLCATSGWLAAFFSNDL